MTPEYNQEPRDGGLTGPPPDTSLALARERWVLVADVLSVSMMVTQFKSLLASQPGGNE
jgi:hypothetical protein